MISFLVRQRQRSDRGAVAIIVGALTIVLFMVAALGVDLASQINRKHLLKNQLDSAATAAAYYLASSDHTLAAAVTNAQDLFARNGQGTLDLHKVDFWCVVSKDEATNGATAKPGWLQIPTVCNPDGQAAHADFVKSYYQSQTRDWDGATFKMTCGTQLCAIPCGLKAGPTNGWNPGISAITASPISSKPITCNTVRIGADQNVPFTFAPAGGIDHGSTGSQIAVACRGVCGQVAPNPMNVVVVTDRTASMDPSDLHALVDGVKGMFKVMSPEQQYVSLGVIGRSAKTSRSSFTACSSSTGGTMATNSANTSGLWVPLKFYKDYLNTAGTDVNPNSDLIKALNCIDPNVSHHVSQTSGTYLAAPLKAAARYVLNKDTDNYNVGSLGGAQRTGQVRNVIIFETDGRPFSDDSEPENCGSTSLDGFDAGCGNGWDIFSGYDSGVVDSVGPASASSASQVGNPYRTSNCSQTSRPCYTRGLSYQLRVANGSLRSGGDWDCQHFIDVANNFKANPDNMVITMGFNLDTTACGSDTGSPLTWLSDIAPRDQASWGTTTGTRKSDCVTGGDGTQPERAMAVRTSNCTLALKLTYTRLFWTASRRVTETLAEASGDSVIGPGSDDTASHCETSSDRNRENTDEDLFFCGASGDQLAAIFQAIATRLTTGVKLLSPGTIG